MRVPIADVGRRGRLDLTFTARGDITTLQDTYCEVPFKITRLHNCRTPGTAHLILMQCTAGLFGGDEVECTIHVERGARVLITQQSANRIHPSEGRPAIQKNRIQVDRGGEAQIYLEPVIPFADSCLRQTTSINVEPGARLSFWEGFMAGRIGRGESWQFRELSSETSLRSNGDLLYLDRFRLLPEERLVGSTWAMASGTYMGTGLYFGAQADYFTQKLHDMLPDAGIDTPIPDLAASRVVTSNGPAFHRYREAFVDSWKDQKKGDAVRTTSPFQGRY